jgi:Myb-like DNA-binding domain
VLPHSALPAHRQQALAAQQARGGDLTTLRVADFVEYWVPPSQLQHNHHLQPHQQQQGAPHSHAAIGSPPAYMLSHSPAMAPVSSTSTSVTSSVAAAASSAAASSSSSSRPPITSATAVPGGVAVNWSTAHPHSQSLTYTWHTVPPPAQQLGATPGVVMRQHHVILAPHPLSQAVDGTHLLQMQPSLTSRDHHHQQQQQLFLQHAHAQQLQQAQAQAQAHGHRIQFSEHPMGGRMRAEWTPEEDSMLAQLVALHGHSWQLIANDLGNSTGSTKDGRQCCAYPMWRLRVGFVSVVVVFR